MPDFKTPLLWLLGVLLVAALGVAGIERTRANEARTDLAKERADRATDRATRSDAARKDSEKTATKESIHAVSIQAASDTFTQPASFRDAALRAELADAVRLRNDATARAARYRAQSEGDAAARRRLADRAEVLDRQLSAGLQVVAGLRGDLVRRDAEVNLLLDVIEADRALLDQEEKHE